MSPKPDPLANARSLRRKLVGYLKCGDFEAAACVERDLVQYALTAVTVGMPNYKAVCLIALKVTKMPFSRWG